MTRKIKKHVKFYQLLSFHKRAIENQYDYLTCSIDWRRNILICTGWLQPSNETNRYKIKIEYVSGHEPKTTIISPKIEPDRDIHMYSDRSVCLYYPPDMAWTEKTEIYKYTIPWISEWIIFYEIFLLTGKWEGKESPTHLTEADRNINRNQE